VNAPDEATPAPRRDRDPADPRRFVEALELPAIFALVADHCASSTGKAALPREPAPSPEVARDEHDRVWSCRRARSQLGGFSFASEAPADVPQRARVPEATLPAEDLVLVWDATESATAARQQADAPREGWERFGAEVDDLPELPAFRTRARRTFDRRGGVRDDATPKLASLRQRKKAIQAQVEQELDRVVRADKQFLSEEFVTRRDGRWVVPVQANYRGRVPGVVVSGSKTGATLYVEPFKVVELSNQLKATEAEEAAEIHRILTELTAMLGDSSDELEFLLDGLARLDALHARAAFADRQDAQDVEFTEDGSVHLKGARHLLVEGCVPIDLVLPAGTRSLVLSGANAGGKTVGLKTLGTTTFLAACGYHVPVERGCATVFPGAYFCLIGDEQSLEHNLSSFSSHVTAASKVLAAVGPGDMVLLDELMGGTDPEEGSALAVEFLLGLAAKGTLSVVTTHYSVLKSLAQDEPHFMNACVEFDEKAFEPTFSILSGSAGPSRGFEIARRFGLPDDLVERARLRLGPERARLEGLLRGVESDRLDAAVMRQKAEDLTRELDEQKRELAATRKELEEKVYVEAKERARDLDEELTRLRRQVLEALEEGRTSDAARLVEETVAAQEELPAPPEKDGWEGLKVGDRVRVAGFGVVGKITELDSGKKRCTVDTGLIQVEADLTRCERTADQGGDGGGGGKRPGRQKAKAPAASGEVLVTNEIHLIGMRAQEAEEKLERELDMAIAHDADAVRVVHGFGTGTLKALVQEVLKRHALVKEVRPGGEHEGGHGATVALFR
jgi:DNA mismatch repair protein MutS2